jgi:hypothetical protein
MDVGDPLRARHPASSEQRRDTHDSRIQCGPRTGLGAADTVADVHNVPGAPDSGDVYCPGRRRVLSRRGAVAGPFDRCTLMPRSGASVSLQSVTECRCHRLVGPDASPRSRNGSLLGSALFASKPSADPSLVRCAGDRVQWRTDRLRWRRTRVLVVGETAVADGRLRRPWGGP